MAWRNFSAQDELLRNAFDEEIERISGRGEQRRYEPGFRALGNDSLHRFLYPWVDTPSVLSRSPRPRPDFVAANRDTVEDSRNVLEELVAKVKNLKSSKLVPVFLQTLESWEIYRDSACHLTALHRQIELADKNSQGLPNSPGRPVFERIQWPTDGLSERTFGANSDRVRRINRKSASDKLSWCEASLSI